MPELARGSGVDRVASKVVEDFGEEWAAFDQTELSPEEHQRLFEGYFSLLNVEKLKGKEGFDLGCGSGRWAALVAPNVGKLHCIDPARKALAVARERLHGAENVEFHLANAHRIPLEDGSQDFGFALGVFHHIADTEGSLRACIAKLKPGAPFLLYLYYRFENRPRWFRVIWRISDLGRRVISRLPFGLKKATTDAIALLVYLPLSRLARLLERRGFDVTYFPLSQYRHYSFYTMRTDALDRFGTKLEKRFTRSEIEDLVIRCGLTDIRFRDTQPHWVVCGRKLTRESGSTLPEPSSVPIPNP